MVSPVSRWAESPCSKLTSAANSNVHRLVGLPKTRRLLCSMARSHSNWSPWKAAWMVRGREDSSRRHSSPIEWKSDVAFRTVWGATSQVKRDPRRPFARGTGQQDLAPAQDEGIGGARAGL